MQKKRKQPDTLLPFYTMIQLNYSKRHYYLYFDKSSADCGGFPVAPTPLRISPVFDNFRQFAQSRPHTPSDITLSKNIFVVYYIIFRPELRVKRSRCRKKGIGTGGAAKNAIRALWFGVLAVSAGCSPVGMCVLTNTRGRSRLSGA